MPYCHISELKTCYLSNIIVKRVQQTKLDSESFVNLTSSVIYLLCSRKTILSFQMFWQKQYDFQHIYFSTTQQARYSLCSSLGKKFCSHKKYAFSMETLCNGRLCVDKGRYFIYNLQLKVLKNHVMRVK